MTEDNAGAELELKLITNNTPFTGLGWAQYIDDLVARNQRRVAAVAASFSQESGLSVSDLISQSSQNARLADMIAGTLESSARTADERKLRALGRALHLGYTTGDDAALDVAEFMLNSIRDLEIPHIKVLDYLIRHSRRRRKEHVRLEELQRLFPTGIPIAYPSVKTLESHGLAVWTRQHSMDPAGGWLVSEYAQFLYTNLLREDPE
jgi:hypothetical protein